MYIKFRDFRIRTKILVASCVFIFFIMGLGGYGYFLLSDNQAKLYTFNNGVLKQLELVNKFQDKVKDSVTALYNVTSTANSETDHAKVEAMIKASQGRFEDIKTSFPEIKAVIIEVLEITENTEPVDDFERSLNAYTKKSQDVLDMVGTDIATASAWTTGAKQKYADMNEKLQDIMTVIGEHKKASIDSMEAQMARGKTVFATSVLFIVVTALFLSLLLGNLISRPLVHMNNVISSLAHKDYNVTIPAIGQKDEMGQMAKSVMTFKDELAKAGTLEAAAEKGREIEHAKAKKREELTASFDDVIGKLLLKMEAVVNSVHMSSDKLKNSADITENKSTLVSTTSQQVSNNIQTVASAGVELDATIKEVASQAAQVAAKIEQIQEKFKIASARYDELNSAAEKIGGATVLIDDIASQTDLLALNATIESARAGEAGKSFSVVASEVKNLANRTTKSTGEIGAMISGMQKEVRDGLLLFQQLVSAMDEMKNITSSIAAAVEEQAIATKEIARNMEDVAASNNNVTRNICEVADEAKSTRESASLMYNSAIELKNAEENLQHEIETFLTDMRAV